MEEFNATYNSETKELIIKRPNMEKVYSDVILKADGGTSDGYHTPDELYYDRMVLFSVICNKNPQLAWKSKLHDDGTMYDNYFIVGIVTSAGDFTYHYHIDHWDEFKVRELPKAPKWDGHTREDIKRLLTL